MRTNAQVPQSRRQMTSRQITFAHAILDGKGPSDAYRLAGYKNGNPTVVPVKAQEVLNTEAVSTYLAQQRAKIANAVAVTKQNAIDDLAVMARDKSTTNRDRISAYAQIGRFLGWDEPQKVEVKAEGTLLWQIRNG